MMNYIKSYKIFESEEKNSDDVIPDGSKYSWNDIKNALYYLTDIGFELRSSASERGGLEYRYSLIDDRGNEINARYNDSDPCKSKYSFEMIKKADSSLFRKSTNYKLYSKDSREIQEIYEEIKSTSAHFDEMYYLLSTNESYNHSDDISSIYYTLSLEVYNDIDPSVINKLKRIKNKEKADYTITNRFNNLIHTMRRSFTPKFLELVYNIDKRGSSIALKQDVKNEFVLIPLNISAIGKGLVTTNMNRVGKIVERWENEFKDCVVDYREVNVSDIEKLVKINPEFTEEDLKERILGMNAIIIEFDYIGTLENITSN